jgi:hypothetical protein
MDGQDAWRHASIVTGDRRSGYVHRPDIAGRPTRGWGSGYPEVAIAGVGFALPHFPGAGDMIAAWPARS